MRESRTGQSVNFDFLRHSPCMAAHHMISVLRIYFFFLSVLQIDSHMYKNVLQHDSIEYVYLVFFFYLRSDRM